MKDFFFYQPLSQFEANLYSTYISILDLQVVLSFFYSYITYLFYAPFDFAAGCLFFFFLFIFDFFFDMSTHDLGQLAFYIFNEKGLVSTELLVLSYLIEGSTFLSFAIYTFTTYCLNDFSSVYFFSKEAVVELFINKNGFNTLESIIVFINYLFFILFFKFTFFFCLVNQKFLIETFTENDFYKQDCNIVWFDLSINKFHLTTFFILVYFCLFFIFCFKNLKYYSRSWNIVFFELLDEFLSSTIIQQLGIKRGQKYSIFLKAFFFLILFSNIFGLIPFSFTITSHLIYTFSLSLSILIAITILGFVNQGISFLKLLVPGGAPALLLPLLVPIEFISYIARCFSLAIRLFANMMSGHTLLNILSSFVIKISGNGFLLLSLAPLAVVLAVSLLEVGIAFLQAYVFLILVCIYLKDAFEAGH